MISFREMKPGDADAVEEVEKVSFSVPWSRKSFWEEATNERTYYLLALDNDKVVGYAGTWILDDEAQITNVAVAPEYRGKKVGAGLMEHLIEEALPSRCTKNSASRIAGGGRTIISTTARTR